MINKKLAIFDFDYTLAKTSECLWLWSPRGSRSYDNKKYTPIHPSSFSKINLADDEYLDDSSFKEFYKLDLDNCKGIGLTLTLLDYYSTKIDNYDSYILTARPPEAETDVRLFLKANNINENKINYVGLKNSDPILKIKYIKNLLSQKKYEEILIYEDNLYVIKNIDSLIKEYKIKKYYIQSNIDNYKITCYE